MEADNVIKHLISMYGKDVYGVLYRGFMFESHFEQDIMPIGPMFRFCLILYVCLESFYQREILNNLQFWSKRVQQAKHTLWHALPTGLDGCIFRLRKKDVDRYFYYLFSYYLSAFLSVLDQFLIHILYHCFMLSIAVHLATFTKQRLLWFSVILSLHEGDVPDT